MSLILEALRKSEAERRRGQVPPLFDATATALPAPPKRSSRVIWWAMPLAVSGVLLVLWRYAPAPAADAPPATGVDTVARTEHVAALTAAEHRPPFPARARNPAEAGTAASAEPAIIAAPRPARALATDPAPARRERAAPAPASHASDQAGRADRVPPPVAASAPREPASISAVASVATPPPLPETSPLQPATGKPARSQRDTHDPAAAVADEAHVAAEAAATLLRLADLTPVQRRSLPPLKMSMHLWSADAAQRFVILDGERMGEGDRIGDVVIDEITHDGAILSWNDRRVMVPLR